MPLSLRNAVRAAFLCTLLAATLPLTASAQSTKGLALSLHADATAWQLDDYDVAAENGLGGGATLSYGFTDLISAFVNVDAATIRPDDGDSYPIAHVDVGVQYTFAGEQFRLYALGGVSGRSVTLPTEIGDLELKGYAATGGIGGYYFFSSAFALDAGLKLSYGTFDELTVGNETTEADFDSTSTRLYVGIRWFMSN